MRRINLPVSLVVGKYLRSLSLLYCMSTMEFFPPRYLVLEGPVRSSLSSKFLRTGTRTCPGPRTDSQDWTKTAVLVLSGPEAVLDQLRPVQDQTWVLNQSEPVQTGLIVSNI